LFAQMYVFLMRIHHNLDQGLFAGIFFNQFL